MRRAQLVLPGLVAGLMFMVAGLTDVAVARTIAGRANYADPSFGADYLAIRAELGTRVRICGAGGCERMTSTDVGPKRSTGDIADIGLATFAKICGWSIAKAERMGECDVSIEFLEAGPAPTLPATDTE